MATMTPIQELRHSAAHVLAAAVLRLFPDAKLDIGPATDGGFYYDFDLDHKFTAEDLAKIEEEMKKIAKENQKFECFEVSREEAAKLIAETPALAEFKPGRLADIPEGEKITFYRNGEFLDLCAGPHVRYTSQIKAVKLLSVAGAYHRGNEKNKQLQRIYGVVFPSKAELDEYLHKLEEAKKRDHRRIGREQKLFAVDDTVGQGLVLWTPNGSVIRQELQTFIGDELFRQGYSQVFTPHIGNLNLFRTSGHFPYYRESQFTPIIEQEQIDALAAEGKTCADLAGMLAEGALDGFLLKPMNCPFHVKLYASQPHSYRDLPVRYAEFGTVYRWEQSGELNGLTRVRGFTQDDGHIFCTEDQIHQEVCSCLELVKIILTTLGMDDYSVRVGLRDPESSKYIGKDENWEKAEAACRAAAATLGVPVTEEKGEAAFYGPKIDFVVKDALGRGWQLGTVQVDFNLPERFGLTYAGTDNEPHRPVMIHRAPFGSLERFVGILIEHYAGAFPAWLAPEQVRLIPITERQHEYCLNAAKELKKAGFRVECDIRKESMGAKIKDARNMRVPFMAVVGDREMQENTFSIRSRREDQLGAMDLATFVKKLRNDVENKL